MSNTLLPVRRDLSMPNGTWDRFCMDSNSLSSHERRMPEVPFTASPNLPAWN